MCKRAEGTAANDICVQVYKRKEVVGKGGGWFEIDLSRQSLHLIIPQLPTIFSNIYIGKVACQSLSSSAARTREESAKNVVTDKLYSSSHR